MEDLRQVVEPNQFHGRSVGISVLNSSVTIVSTHDTDTLEKMEQMAKRILKEVEQNGS